MRVEVGVSRRTRALRSTRMTSLGVRGKPGKLPVQGGRSQSTAVLWLPGTQAGFLEGLLAFVLGDQRLDVGGQRVAGGEPEELPVVLRRLRGVPQVRPAPAEAEVALSVALVQVETAHE